jgi:hypothetical protein
MFKNKQRDLIKFINNKFELTQRMDSVQWSDYIK